MTLWTLEVARLTRTFRGLALVAIYAFFGLLGPITARYMAEILERFATDELTVTVADPTPLDGLVQFIGNASQLAVLAVVIVAAGALAIDARAELAAFLRTRVAHPRDLVIPRYLLVTAASAIALTVGTVIAVVLTTVLIGDLPLGATAVGTVYGILYLAFAIAVVAAVAGFVRSQLAAVFVSILVLLLLPVIGIVDAIAAWLPSSLLTAVLPIVAGEPAIDHLRAVAVTVIAIPLLVQLAIVRADRREL